MEGCSGVKRMAVFVKLEIPLPFPTKCWTDVGGQSYDLGALKPERPGTITGRRDLAVGISRREAAQQLAGSTASG